MHLGDVNYVNAGCPPPGQISTRVSRWETRRRVRPKIGRREAGRRGVRGCSLRCQEIQGRVHRRAAH